jgi:hypothetical protein
LYPDDAIKARDERIKRMSDAWRFNHPAAVPTTDAWQSPAQLAAGRRFADTEAQLKALMPQHKGNPFLDREAAYEARKMALENAWRRPEQPIRDNPASGGTLPFAAPLSPALAARQAELLAWRLTHL